MNLSRREWLASCALAVPALADERPRPAAKMGLVIHSFPIHVRAARERGDKVPFADPLHFLDHTAGLGAGGIQVALGARDRDYRTQVRRKLEETGLYLEGIVSLPRDRDDVDRFRAELAAAKECGATVLRTVCLSGRRYETFDTAESFRTFVRRSTQSLTLAEPVAAKEGVRLAVENHKDWRIEELIDLLKRLSSKHVGVCVDTGNSIALLEDPLAVVEAYAPWAVTTHFKDMAVAEYADGFLLSEVPLGAGFLDLQKVAGVLRKANPSIRLNLEMITRDPLKVPCLTSKYWTTLETLPARHLADALARVRKHAAKEALPVVSRLALAKQLDVESDNVRRSLRFAGDRLGL